MKIPVFYLNFNPEASTKDYWDYALVNDVIFGRAWKPALGYEFGEVTEAPSSGAVVVIPARHNAGYEQQVQEYISRLDWVVLILGGDEERSFDYKRLSHPKMKVWLMQPRMDDEADFYLGSGYPPQARELIRQHEQEYLTKPIDWYFGGQVNHMRRSDAAYILRRMATREDVHGEFAFSGGFAQGERPEDYFRRTVSAKAIPAISGVESPDSFRLYEALESGSVPVADEFSKLVGESGYWQKVFGEGVPFKVLNDFANLEGYICDVLRDYPTLQNKVFAWWLGYKRKMVYKLRDHVRELVGE